jgi:hypothetical protein
VLNYIMRSIIIILTVLSLVLGACEGSTDIYDPRTPAFKRSSLKITAEPAALVVDSTMIIRTEGLALVSGKGRISISVYHTKPGGVLYIDAPLLDTITAERATGEVAYRSWYPLKLVANQAFDVPWSIRANLHTLYRFDVDIELDSVLTTDGSGYLWVDDSVAKAQSPGGHGYDRRMNYLPFYIGEYR